MAFEVQPAALRELAGLLDRAREDVQKIRDHLAGIRELAGGEGVLNQIVGGHQAICGTLDEWIGRLASPTLTAAADAVADSATYYEHTDAASAEKLDGTYPSANVADARERAGSRPFTMPDGQGRFSEITEPTAQLRPVKDYTQELDASPNWWETASPMAGIGVAIETVSHVAVWLEWLDRPYDPMAELVKPFVGDWAGVRAAADVMRDVAAAVYAVGDNITWASQGTEAVWQGNAGSGAAVYLLNLSTPLAAFPDPLYALAESYEAASREMMALRDAAVNVLNQIGDAAIQAAAACGFSAGAASSGVGTPVAALIALYAGYKIHRVVDGIRSLMEVVGKLDTLTALLKASQTEFGELQNGVTLPALPDRPPTVPK